MSSFAESIKVSLSKAIAPDESAMVHIDIHEACVFLTWEESRDLRHKLAAVEVQVREEDSKRASW